MGFIFIISVLRRLQWRGMHQDRRRGRRQKNKTVTVGLMSKRLNCDCSSI